MKYLIILFFIYSCTLFAQIKGRVLKASDQSPLPFANIIVEGKNIGTSSDSSGYFTLSYQLNLSDKIKISYLGYEPKIFSVSEFTPNVVKNIYLNSKLIPSQTILVEASIGEEGKTPITFSKVNRAEIQADYIVQDIPQILSSLPSTTFYSENGNGIGYNYLSIRGFDQRRISVSINGIPQNDPEDHNVYWLDFPDLLDNTELIQVQRGAGSGIIGYPAIGGSINIITSSFTDKPTINFNSSVGSYNTRKYSFSFGSGLISNKYSFYAKLSQILSSGYRNSSWTNFKAYYFSAVRYDKDFITQLNLYGGPIADGLAYEGLPKFAIKDKNLRRANYSYWEANNNNYTYTLERRPEEIENFFQPHFELLNEWQITQNIKFNSALFLVLGNGFFDYDGSWADTSYFRLTAQNGFHPTQNPTDALIRAQVDNTQWGWIPRLSFKHENGDLIFGGEFRLHSSVHWGSINYGSNLPEGLTKSFRYYYYEGGNNIFNFFVHENYYLNERFSLLGELQFAYHKYQIKNERYLSNNFSLSDLFVNPRLGVNFSYNNNLSFYFAFARTTREPRLKNYYDAAESSGGSVPQFKVNPDGSYDFSKPLVNPETMNDFEFGADYNANNVAFSVNLFYMLFNNEIVKQGQVDRFGQPITGNADQTIHRGIELTASVKFNKWFSFIVNGTLSDNYISKGINYIKSNGQTFPLDLSGNRISGFPDVMFNGIIKINYNNFYANISAKYVGKYYSDNYDKNLAKYLKLYPNFIDYTDNEVPSYFTTDVYLSYDLNLDLFSGPVKIFAQINNVFDNLYAAYAIGKSFFPAAERTFLFGFKFGI
ncbi:TonB-dependent receptor [Melioribacteraceae bacterium 4301-Me]|uniref:TonB-dependent receptor n=1 Tax=Pyranulibacter aquaticus TaxID=3163344 RepID=UPI0035999F21